jgi:hypothetical protein
MTNLPTGDFTECRGGPLDGVRLWFPAGDGTCAHTRLRVAEYRGDDGIARLGATCQECGAVGCARDHRGAPIP